MNKLRDAIYGFTVADALGVPFEFNQKGSFLCTDMIGHGTWNQPEGTWSDDSSMTLATCDSIRINKGINYLDIMNRFLDWINYGKYAINSKVFDVGNTTLNALRRFDGISPFCGINDIRQNGNGALMRVLPLAFIPDITDEQIKNVAIMTHGHDVSSDLCIEYVRIAQKLIRGEEVSFEYTTPIKSSGYVVDTFNSVMYCLATTDNYSDCVLKAVNLGNDTDTVSAIAGGLAGIKYGYDSIPSKWISKLKGKEIIESCLF